MPLYLVRGRYGRRKSSLAGVLAASAETAIFLVSSQPGPRWTDLTAVEMWRCFFCRWPNTDMAATICEVCRCSRAGVFGAVPQHRL